MKKILTLISSVLLLGLCACNGNTPASSPADPSSASGLSVSTSQSSSSESQPSSSESTQASASGLSSIAPAEDGFVYGGDKRAGDAGWVDYASNGSVVLGLDYHGRNFYTDGIEQVTLWQTIDGDTAHFTPKSGGDTIKSRFYGIDTPESTGKVQEWGYEASEYTSNILRKAKTIVVSTAQADYGAPQADSTGTRYVSLIWVNMEKQNAEVNELHLLNLDIVQVGLSNVKNVSSMPDYVDSFYAAENQARDYKINMFSGLPAPHYNYGDYEDASLLDIKQAVVKQLREGTANAYDNKKVRVHGTVAGFANNILYIQDFFPTLDEDGNEQVDGQGNIIGEYAGINIFVGMSAIPSKYTTPNTYIQVSGLAKDSQFGFQITDTSFPTVSYADRDAKVILRPAANTEEHALHVFQYSVAELAEIANTLDFASLYCAFELTDNLTVRDVNNTDSGNNYVYFNEVGAVGYYKFVYTPYPDRPQVQWDAERLVGKTFKISGVIATHTTTKGVLQIQITLRNSNDLVLIED